MKENLKIYLQSLFASAPHTARNDALFEELLGNLYDRYDELTVKGIAPAEAYAKVIGELGDVRPLIERSDTVFTSGYYRENPSHTGEAPRENSGAARYGKKVRLSAEELRRTKRRGAAALAAAVMLYILWLVPCVLFDWGFVFLFLCIAAGTVLLVYSHSTAPDFIDDSALSYPPEMRERDTRLSNILLAAGVGFCILCIVPAAIIDNEWGAALMFLIVGLGVGMILYACGIKPGLDKIAARADYMPLEHHDPAERYEKKRNGWLLPVVLICICAVIASCIWGVLNGLSFGLFGIAGEPLELYVNEGDAAIETDLKHLTIDWTAGTVTVELYDGDKIEFFETEGGRPVEAGKERMRWYEEDGDLYIRFDGYSNIRFYWGTQPQKDLTVRIPADEVLEGVDADLISASFTMSHVTVNEAEGVVDIDTVSGAVSLWHTASKKIGLDSVSGILSLTNCVCAELEADSVSGNLMLQSARLGKVEFNGTSANFKASDCSYTRIVAETTSGEVTLPLCPTASAIIFNTVSGDMHLTVDDTSDIGFSVDFDSVSGDFECSLATDLTIKDGIYRYGNGYTNIKMDSTSGDLIIMGN